MKVSIRFKLTIVNNLKLKMKLPEILESETAPTTTDYNEALFSNTDNVLKRYFQIQTTVSINCTNCQKIDRGDATGRLIRLC